MLFDVDVTNIEDEDEDGKSGKKKVRFDANFHRYIRNITESATFNSLIMITIGLNSMTMALETYYELKINYAVFFMICDELFLAIYTLEFSMKLYAEPKGKNSVVLI